MIFLTDDDFTEYQVRTEVLQVLTISETSLDTAELSAQEQATSYIRARYDAAATFAATGVARNPLIVMYMIDLILYHLHSNTPSRVVPKQREDRFNAAITWLEKVNGGALLPTLPELPDTTPDPIYRFGSDCQYSNRW
jgi:phage gp36-like protein